MAGDNFRFFQTQPYTLSGAGTSIGDTSVVLSSMTDIDGNVITMAGSFGTIGFGTLEPGSGTQEEQICWTGLTNNTNGTTTLTGVSSVTFGYPYTKTSGLLKSHAGGARFVVSNTSGFYDEMTSKDDDETINGLWTFAQFPQKSGSLVPTAAADFATKSYVDSVVGGLTVTDQLLITGVAGETLALGNAVYLKTADQRWWKADASATNTSVGVQIGFADSVATAGTAVNILIQGYEKNLSGLSAGSDYFLTNTPGTISTTAGTNRVLIANAVSATLLLVESISTKAQNAGNSGTPSSANTFVTQSGFQVGAEIYAATATGNDTYVVTLSPVPTAYANGQTIRFKVDVGNTGAATLNVNGLGPIAITKLFNVALTTGDILANQIVEVTYNSTGPVFELQSTTAQIQHYANAQLFLVSGTWTKPNAASFVEVFAVGGGAGGGGGSRQTSATGGGGAGGGAFTYKSYSAASLAATESIVVAATGGAGGAGQGAGTTGNGAAGTAGTNTTFSSGGTLLTANAGSPGSSGATGNAGAGGTVSAADTVDSFQLAGGAGGAGGSGAANGSAGASLTVLPASGRGGGGGGGAATSNQTGGAGGTNTQTTYHASYGFPAKYTGANYIFNYLLTSSGGLGGDGIGSGGGGAGGDGGVGVFPGGAGGGGGGKDTDDGAQKAGDGGTGAPGFVLVVTWF